MILQEGQLRFDFSGALRAMKMDGQNSPMPNLMKKVDFLVEETDRILLVEVKDPSDSQVTATNRDDFMRRLKSNELVTNNLVPKCRDTYTYLHLMCQDDKPLIYVVVLSMYEHTQKPERFGPLQDSLRRGVKKEGPARWERQYVRDCVVLNVAGWNKRFAYTATKTYER